MKRHKHADLIKQWAEGETIQCLCGLEWYETETPTWDEHIKFRVKPKDIVLYAVAEVNEGGITGEVWAVGNGNYNPKNNVSFIFDSETGKLKGVELL